MGLRQNQIDTGYIETKFISKNIYSNHFLSIILGIGKTITSKKGKEAAVCLLYTNGLREMVSHRLDVNLINNGQQKSYGTTANLNLSAVVLKISYYPFSKKW